jgi:hypothetical protein
MMITGDHAFRQAQREQGLDEQAARVAVTMRVGA